MDAKIFVIYVGVAGLRTEDIPDYVQKVAGKITPQSFDGEVILIPVQLYDTRIVCINPEYITEPELVEKHRTMMKELHEALQNQLEQLKAKSNE
jgi:N-formylglutamate amidohydrolase